MAAISSGHTWNTSVTRWPLLVTAFTSSAPPSGKILHFINRHWVLDYSLDQNGYTRVGTGQAPWRRRGPGVAHLYPPGTPYWEDTARDTARIIRSAFILFHAPHPSPVETLIVAPWPYARILDPDGALYSHLQALADLGRTHGDRGTYAAQGRFLQVIDALSSACRVADESWRFGADTASGSAQPESPDAALAARVDAYFRQHLNQPIELAGVARALNLSLSSLAHRYRAHTGQAPGARLIELRLNLATGLILRGERLDRVAAQTGFYDAFHLSKSFKQKFGCSPRQYLRERQPK